jgi:hypothetical protein
MFICIHIKINVKEQEFMRESPVFILSLEITVVWAEGNK